MFYFSVVTLDRGSENKFREAIKCYCVVPVVLETFLCLQTPFETCDAFIFRFKKNSLKQLNEFPIFPVPLVCSKLHSSLDWESHRQWNEFNRTRQNLKNFNVQNAIISTSLHTLDKHKMEMLIWRYNQRLHLNWLCWEKAFIHLMSITGHRQVRRNFRWIPSSSAR